MKTDIQVGSKIKVIDKQSPYFRWRGTVSAETLVAERVEGQPKPDVSSFLCTLHLDGKHDKVELKPEQIACIQKKFIDIEHIREEDIYLGNGVVRRSNVGAFEVGDQIQISEKIDGANAKTVSNKIICIVFTVSCGSVALSTPIVTVGIVRFVVANDTEENIKNIIKTIEINFIFLIICTSNPSFTFYC